MFLVTYDFGNYRLQTIASTPEKGKKAITANLKARGFTVEYPDDFSVWEMPEGEVEWT